MQQAAAPAAELCSAAWQGSEPAELLLLLSLSLHTILFVSAIAHALCRERTHGSCSQEQGNEALLTPLQLYMDSFCASVSCQY